jgi:predicted DNA-binding transcriptional regulator AlpA
MHSDKYVAINDICTTLRIGRTTLYRYLNGQPGPASHHTGGCNDEPI